ncbi:class I SAM-dependent methyltransferase [Clostridium sp. YIM B02551]|uniref:class I SAM-dependent methyltransferase n=1 Tax=Clostridium sp. YIM B02551 TaxID=2910679 RepID=UPI001EEAD760|nr:class I SAM-dependent methyltransferase [Clostridium sp. YIM B02551]
MNKHEHNSKGIGNLQRKIEALDGVERMKNFPPEEILQMLDIKKNDNILDLGAGTGYLSIPSAQMVDGLVYALDMDPKILEVIDTKSKDKNITNIKLIEGRLDNIPLTDDSIDIALASLVLHEVNPLSKTLNEIKRVLKDGGHFLCFEIEKKESHITGKPMPPRISSLDMEKELIDAGFKITQKVFPDDLHYIFIVKK